MDKDLITLKELSKRLSLSPRTIRAWVHDPERAMPAYHVGGKLLFRWGEVERWVERFRVKPVHLDELADEMVRKALGSAGQRDSGRRRRR